MQLLLNLAASHGVWVLAVILVLECLQKEIHRVEERNPQHSDSAKCDRSLIEYISLQGGIQMAG
jgi:hypothetical protein